MRCCRPSLCSVAPLAVGGWIASDQLAQRISWAWLVWIAIIFVVLALSVFTVSPASPDKDAGEPPP